MEGCIWILLVLAVLTFVIAPLVLALVAMGRTGRSKADIDNLQIEVRGLRKRLISLEHPQGPTPKAPAPPKPPEAAEVKILKTPDPVKAPDPVPEPVPPPVRLPPPLNEREPRAPIEAEVPLERMVGERILPWVGVTVLVLGIGLFLWYAYTVMGPRGRLILAGITGAVMAGGGAGLLRLERYRVIAGCVIAGGWTTLYATAYAAHFVEASRVIPSPTVAYLVLFAVGAGAVVHALRFNHEWITGAAYVLLFVTLFMSPNPGLAAWITLAVAGAGLVEMTRRRGWIRLCVLGAAVLYAAEVFWFREAAAAQLTTMGALLAGLWVLWTLPDYFHKPTTEMARAAHLALVIVNFAGVVAGGALLQDWFNLPRTGAIRLTLGGVYLAKAMAEWGRTWPPVHLANLMFAAVLICAGSHDFLPDIWPAMAWLGLGAFFFGYGLATREAWTRLLGHAITLAGASRIWLFDLDVRSTFVVGAWKVRTLLLPAISGAALFYAQAAITARLNRIENRADDLSTALPRFLLHSGGMMVMLAIWYFPPPIYVALLYALSGLIVLELARKVDNRDLLHQSLLLISLAAIFVATVNLTAVGQIAGISRRLAATVPVLAVWLYARESLDPSGNLTRQASRLFAVLLCIGSFALARFEIGASGTPLMWMVLAMIWIAWSRWADHRLEFALGVLSVAGAVLMFSSTAIPSIPWVGLQGPATVGIPLAAAAVALHAWNHISPRRGWGAVFAFGKDLLAVAVAAAVFILLARKVSGTWLTFSWALLGFGLAAYGFTLQDRTSRWASLAVLGTCLGKVLIFDFATFSMPVKIATLLTLGAVMIAMSFIYVRFRTRVVAYLVGNEPAGDPP